jgi:hypothetical protein
LRAQVGVIIIFIVIAIAIIIIITTIIIMVIITIIVIIIGFGPGLWDGGFFANAGFFANLAQFGLHATWVLYTGHRYGWGPREVGFSLTAVGLGAAIVQGGLARRVIPALGERTSVLLGLALGVIAYAGYGLATQGWMIYAAIAVATVNATNTGLPAKPESPAQHKDVSELAQELNRSSSTTPEAGK